MTWALGWVLPNIQVQDALDAAYIALVPFNDPRLVALARAQPNVNTFLSRFTDEFCAPVPPSVILVRTDAPRTLGNEAAASFRDLVAISIIPYSQAQQFVWGGGPRMMFSDSLWLYPWVPAVQDDSRIVRGSLGQNSMHLVSAFHGHTNPDVSSLTINRTDIDRPLFDELVKRWERRYAQTPIEPFDTKLFRSMNMANVALRAPATVDATFLDIGRTIALWVSAFEILVHPGKGGKSDLNVVCNELKKVAFRNAKVAATTHGNNNKLSLPVWVYEKLYIARNKFLHGNPVDEKDLYLTGTKVYLSRLAPLVYRLALTAFLPLTFDSTAPSSDDAEATGKFLSDKTEIDEFQEIIERALSKALK